MCGHDALRRRGARPVALSVSVVLGLFVLHGRGLALVLTGVLLQEVQSFGLTRGLHCGTGPGRFLALVPLRSVRGERVTGREVRA